MPNFPPPPPITIEIDNKVNKLNNELFTLDMLYKQYTVKPLTVDGNPMLVDLYSHLKDLSKLKENWDGYNAISISKTVIEITKNLLLKLPNIFLGLLEKDSISPNSNGTISIEWEQDENTKLFLEIGKTYSSYFLMQKDKNAKIVNKFPLSEKRIPPQLIQDLRFLL